MTEVLEQPLTEHDYQKVGDMVHRHCGITLHDGKRELVKARIAKRLRATGHGSIPEYLKAVETDASGREFIELIDAMSTNLTSFFREENHFVHLRQAHLPTVIERKAKVRDRRLRVWSAGCSSGEEPYSLAMTILEALDGAGTWDVRILATDISTHVLRLASAGVYAGERLASVPAALRGKYFRAAPLDDGAAGFAASDALRNLIHFRHLNLMAPWPFNGPLDFIFCRNVMIYFDKPTQERLVGRYFDLLAPGGLLFTGHSESLTGINHRFKYVLPTIYRKP